MYLFMYCQLCCVEEDTEKVIQSIGPIHPDTREAEFKHLKKGNYCVYLEVHVSAAISTWATFLYTVGDETSQLLFNFQTFHVQ